MEYEPNPVLQIEIDTESNTKLQEHIERLEELTADSSIPTSMEDISDLLKKMKFKHVLMGGVDDADVWRQLEKLDEAYRTLLAFRQEEFSRICAMLEQKNKDLTMQLIQLSYDYSWAYEQLERLKVELEQMKGGKS
ncbi:MAG: hypothetical protein IJ675_05465 [Pseudobutyrivibrio sp.]|nr:hypothetical protein [Pseudobutyrivibrio sp.]